MRPAHVLDGRLARDRIESDPEAYGLLPRHAVVGLVVVPGRLDGRARLLDEDVLVEEPGMGGPHQGGRDGAGRALEHEPAELVEPVPVAVVLEEGRAPVVRTDGPLEGARIGHDRGHSRPERLHPLAKRAPEHDDSARLELFDDRGGNGGREAGARTTGRREPLVAG